MTQSSHATPGSDGDDMPPVDQVIHDIREGSGHLRAPESAEPLPGTRAPGGPDEVSSAHHPSPLGTAVGGAPPGTGHEASGQAPGHGGTLGHGSSAAHDDGHSDGHESGDELGPIDTANWGAGILGVAIGVLIAACFAIATQGLGAY